MAPAHGEVCDVAAGRLGEGVHRDEARHRPHPEASATEGGGVPRVEVSPASLPAGIESRSPNAGGGREVACLAWKQVPRLPLGVGGGGGGIFVYAGFRVDLFLMATEPVGRFNGTF